MHDPLAPELVPKDNDARLQHEFRLMEHHLQRMGRSLARATSLREATRVANAAQQRRLTYQSVSDANMARMGALIAQMNIVASEMLAGHTQTVAEKLRDAERATRRLSIKIEQDAATVLEMATALGEAAPEEAVDDVDPTNTSFTIDMDEPEANQEEDEPPSGAKTSVAKTTKLVGDGKKSRATVNVLGVVVSSPPLVENPGKTGSEVSPQDALMQRVAECLRLATSTNGSDGENPDSSRRVLLKSLASAIQDVDATFTFARSYKPRGPVPDLMMQTIAETVELTMAGLSRNAVAFGLVQSVLRLDKTMLTIRHPKLKTLFARPRQVLQGIVNDLAETLGGMKRRGGSDLNESDERAFECFALAINLHTTTDKERRGKLIDDVLHALKQGFRPVVLHTDVLSHARAKDDGHTKRCVVTWAGRVMLLAAHIVAHIIAMYGVHPTDQFLKITDHIGARHELFPQFFERVRTKVQKAPYLLRPTEPLDLPREAARIQRLDTVV